MDTAATGLEEAAEGMAMRWAGRKDGPGVVCVLSGQSQKEQETRGFSSFCSSCFTAVIVA